MINGLDDLENILNGNKTDRQILIEYQKSEIRKLNPAVYEPLLRDNQNPQLTIQIEKARNAIDPMADLAALKAGGYLFDSFRTIKDSVLEEFEEISDYDLDDLDISFFDGFDELKNLKEVASYVKEIVGRFDNLSYLLNSVISVTEDHYGKLAKAIRTVSDSRQKTIAETVGNTTYLYEAKRIVIPEKIWAEKYLDITTKAGREFMDSVSTIGLLIEKSLGRNGISKEIIETRDASKRLSEAVFSYRMKELDAIYGK